MAYSPHNFRFVEEFNPARLAPGSRTVCEKAVRAGGASLFNICGVRKGAKAMSEAVKKKMLDRATYERLCIEACEKPDARADGETSEDACWRTICEKVSDYLGAKFESAGGGASPGETYRQRLSRMVEAAQAEYFDPLEIPEKYVKEILSKTGG